MIPSSKSPSTSSTDTASRERQLLTMIEIERFLLMERNLNRKNCLPLLKLCAELAEVDRITVFQYHPSESGNETLSVIAEWCAEGMEMQTQWQNLNLQSEQYQTVLERARQILNTGEMLMCHVKELTIAEQMLSSSGGVQALLLIPISVKNRFCGIAALQRVKSSALWDEEIRNFLKSTAVAVSIALERKYAEQDLVEAKEQFQAVLDAVPGFVSWIDSSLTYLGLNQYLASMLGKPVEEYIGKKVGFLNPKFHDFLKRLFESPYQGSIMEDTVTIGGRRMQHLIVAQKYHHGKAAVCVGIDITDRKIMEEKLREQAALLEITRDAVILQELDGRVLYWNASAKRIYGWTKEEVLGRNIKYDLYSESDIAEDDVRRQILFEKGEWSGELRQRTKDGKVIIVESRCALVPNENGEPDKVLIVNTDITEKKNLESQMLRNQRMDSIGLLASGIAHDMNNVLAPILAGLLLLRQHNPDEQAKRWIDMLEKSAERGKELMRQILSFARGESGEKTVLNLSQLAKDVYRFVSQTFPKEIEVQLEAPSTIWMILGDSTKLYQAVLNLCVNARDAMPNGGKLTLEVKNVVLSAKQAALYVDAKEGEYVQLTVTDTGTGISPDVLDKIFEPFFTTKEVGKGTGLGLSIVYSVVNSHGGFLDVQTKLGQGTSFMLYFPATKAQQTQLIEEPIEAMAGCGEVILLVEDDVGVREVANAVLLSMGYTVLTANNGAEAVALFAMHQDEISLVLTDIMMPIMDGIACVHAIRAIKPSVPVVIMTGLMDGEKVAKLSTVGIQGSINKPFRAEALLQTVFRALKQTEVRT